MELKPFTGIVAVDFGAGMPAALVAKFLLDYGARVIRVAPPGGDPFEGIYPAYAHWREGAECIDAAHSGTSELQALLATADICITGGEDYPGLARRADIGTLATRHPALILLDIQAAPHGSPWASIPAVEVLMQAASGLAFEQYSDHPLYMGFQPCCYGAALQGMLGITTALYERTRSGRGQRVETSLLEGAWMWLGMFWADFEQPTRMTDFVLPRDPHPTVFRCADGRYIHFVTGSAGHVKFAEQTAQFAGIGLAQEGVELLDQRRNAGLFVHRLVGQRAEFAAQRGDHPAREVEITALGGAEMLLDRNQLLLADETVPTAQRLGVLGRIGIIGSHVRPHDLGGVLGDVQPGLEPVLQPHAGNAFGVDPAPAGLVGGDRRCGVADRGLVGHEHSPGMETNAACLGCTAASA